MSIGGSMMADNIRQQLGNYRLIRLIGRGGFAEVYLGEHIHLGTQAAIKVLQTRLAGEDQQRFFSESLTIARLRHPNIVRVLDFGVDGDTPFLVMDYAPAGTLRQRHSKGTRLPASNIVPYIRQAASALQYAHDQKVIHRDVKPENMLMGANNEILLTDFGIALVTQSSRYQTTQEVVGTVVYMAPEQLQGKPRTPLPQLLRMVLLLPPLPVQLLLLLPVRRPVQRPVQRRPQLNPLLVLEQHSSLTAAIPVRCILSPGHLMELASPLELRILRYRYGMRLAEGMSLPIGAIRNRYMLSHGHLMGNSLYLAVLIIQRRSGMLQQEAKSSAITIQVRCVRWHGLPMDNLSLLPVMTAPSRFGMLVEILSSLIAVIQPVYGP